MASNQAYLFLIFTINGILIGFLFDIFRILRKSFKTNDLVTYIEDIIFWILTGIIILFSMCKFCDGELRGFTIIGIAMGVILYMLTISTYIIKVSVFIIYILKTVISKTINIIIYPFKLIFNIMKKIIFKPISIICINIRKKVFETTNKIYKNIKNVKKPQKV